LIVVFVLLIMTLSTVNIIESSRMLADSRRLFASWALLWSCVASGPPPTLAVVVIVVIFIIDGLRF
jgi:hypothetical protein